MHNKDVANNTCATKVQQQHMRALKDQQQHMHNKGPTKQGALMGATTCAQIMRLDFGMSTTTCTQKKIGIRSFNQE
jgi:hypothetical protein